MAERLLLTDAVRIEELEKEFKEAEDVYSPLDTNTPTESNHSTTAELLDSEGLHSSDVERTFSGEEMSCNALQPSSSSSTEPSASPDYLDRSHVDEEEQATVEGFMVKTCGCKLGPSKTPCSRQFSLDVVKNFRSDCLQLSRDQLDLAVTAQLSSCRTHKDTIPPSYRGSIDNFRPHTSFSFRGIRICSDMFLLLHAMSDKRFKNICKHFDSEGLVERIHGNVRRLPSNTCTNVQIDDLVAFIDNVAQSHAMPLPGRMPNHRDSRVLLLPTDMTKASIYLKYVESCQRNQTSPVGRTKFHTVWSEVRAHVVTMRPADDLCMDCQTLCTSIRNSTHLPESVKEQRLKTYIDHLNLAKQARQHYNEQIDKCKASITTTPSDITLHYSYDFAQQLHYPNNPLQPGPAYFLSARKCQLFGVACEPLNWQLNYLIDEADVVGKGANTTISLVHHFLENKAPHHCAHIYLHAENCIGQNKNNATMQYLCWRVLTGKQRHIAISFMLPGHTKFAPDRHFGLIKKVYRRTRVDTIGCLQKVVINSSHIGANKVQLVRDSSGQQVVHFYGWSSFLQQYFSNLPSITSFRVFEFDCRFPGKVFAQKSSSQPPEEFSILRPSASLPSHLPDICPSRFNPATTVVSL